jgi:Ca2+-binding RTX toxin-like protein
MANTTIKGKHYESQVITDSDSQIKLDKNAFVHYGGVIDLSELIPEEGEEAPTSVSFAFGYGIAEDIATNPDISGNSYKIDGKVTGLFGAMATFGDDTTIKIGKTADLNGGLGIGLASISEDDALSGLTFGTVFVGGHNSKVTIANGAEINGLFGVTVAGLGSSVTNSGDIDTGIVGMMSGGFNLGGLGLGFGEAMMVAPLAAATTTRLTNNGSIESLVGIAGFQSDNQVLANGKKGEIEGLVGIIGGTIPTGAEPVEVGTLKLQNDGSIIAAVGMLGLMSPDMTLINSKGAEIISGVIGMGALSMDGMSSTIINAGTIRVTLSLVLPEEMEALLPISSAAIFGFAGAETVTNSGKVFGDVFLGAGDDVMTNIAGLIKGDVVLGDGNDTFDHVGGKLTGKIFGGMGDDTLIVGKATDKLIESADYIDVDNGDAVVSFGIDTVKSAFTYTLSDNVENLVLTGKNDIDGTGNGLDNTLTGNQGDNLLTGAAGIDVLTGGGGADTFVFATGGGNDTIVDLTTAQHDRIDVSGWTGIIDLASIQANATEVDGDVVITFGGDVLVIADHLIADLSGADFIFV